MIMGILFWHVAHYNGSDKSKLFSIYCLNMKFDLLFQLNASKYFNYARKDQWVGQKSGCNSDVVYETVLKFRYVLIKYLGVLKC